DLVRKKSELDSSVARVAELEAQRDEYQDEVTRVEGDVADLAEAKTAAEGELRRGMEDERLRQLDEAARQAGASSSIPGVSAAKNLNELAQAVKDARAQRRATAERRREFAGESEGRLDPALADRDQAREAGAIMEELLGGS
ncbi:MAG: hypothetical protein KDD53_05195, partial [Bdellovibrionales bacterium]|nr:hypothetical protein [Bdellovibrionales bacterium]